MIRFSTRKITSFITLMALVLSLFSPLQSAFSAPSPIIFVPFGAPGTDVSSVPVQNDPIMYTVTSNAGTITTLEYGFSPDAICNVGDTYGNHFLSDDTINITTDHSDYLCFHAIDSATNEAYYSAGQLHVDTTHPVVPGVPVLSPSPITTGNSSSITLSGTGEANGVVYYTLYDSGNVNSIAGTGSIDAIGDYSILGLNLSSFGYGTLTISVSVRDQAGNAGSSTVGYDTKNPSMVLSEVSPVRNNWGDATITNNTSPFYTFSASMTGVITYSGSCSSATTDAVVGNNDITFNTLTDGTYSDCSLTVINGSESGTLAISPFSIETIVPTFTISSYTGGKLPTLNIANYENYTLSGTYTETGAGMKFIAYRMYKVSPFTNLVSDEFVYPSGTGSNVAWSYTWADFFNNQPSLTGTGDHGTFRFIPDFYDFAANRGYGAFDGIYDFGAPVITLSGANVVNLFQGTSYTDAGASAMDNADGNITAGIVTSGATINTSVTGSYLVTYNVTDAAGNPATQVTRTMNVTANPITTITSFPTVNIDNSGAVDFAGTCTIFGVHNTDDTIYIKIEDASGSLVSASSLHCNGGTWVDTEDLSFILNNGILTATVLQNNSGNLTNTGNTKTAIKDTVAPLITLNGSASVTVSHGSIYTDAGASWTDAIDGTGSVTASGSVNTAIDGTYILTYSHTDVAGNTGSTISRTVTVSVAAPSSGNGGGGGGNLPTITSILRATTETGALNIIPTIIPHVGTITQNSFVVKVQDFRKNKVITTTTTLPRGTTITIYRILPNGKKVKAGTTRVLAHGKIRFTLSQPGTYEFSQQ